MRDLLMFAFGAVLATVIVGGVILYEATKSYYPPSYPERGIYDNYRGLGKTI